MCNGEVNCVSYDDNLIKLQKNISLSYNDNNVANIMNNITLDLNGYTIENISNNLTNSYFINIDTEKFTIEDSSESKNGKITTNMRGIANVQSGVLYINGGTFNAIRESAYAFGIANGKLYFNNGTINSNNVGIHMFGSNSYLEMKMVRYMRTRLEYILQVACWIIFVIIMKTFQLILTMELFQINLILYYYQQISEMYF